MELGILYQYGQPVFVGYRIWFLMDCFITYSLFRYGYKQISIPALKKRSKVVIAFGIVCWLVLLYFYIKNYDYPISKNGAYSGYILNIVISACYIPQFLRLNNKRLFSAPVKWSKAIGTALISVFCFMHYNDWFLLSLCIVTAVLDAIYLFIFHTHKAEDNAVPASILSQQGAVSNA